MMIDTRSVTAAFAAAFLIAVAGCAEGDLTLPTPSFETVQVQPEAVTLAVGESADVSVGLVTRGGVQGTSVTWSSADQSVATVSQTSTTNATVTGQGAGTVDVTAVVTAENVDGSVSDTLEVTVN